MKWIQSMIKLLISIMVTSIVCVVCTFTVMNAYIDMVLDQYQLKSSAITAPSWSQFMAHLGKQAEGFHLFADGKKETGADDPRSGSTNKTRDTPPNDSVAVFGHQKGTESAVEPKASNSLAGAGESSEWGSGGATKPNATSTKEATALNTPNGGTKPDVNSDSSKAGKVVVSGEDFTKKKEQLSNEDKNQIFKLLLTRVPQPKIQQISRMMEDGITASELSEIEQLLQKYLKPEEYSQLLSMIKP